MTKGESFALAQDEITAMLPAGKKKQLAISISENRKEPNIKNTAEGGGATRAGAGHSVRVAGCVPR